MKYITSHTPWDFPIAQLDLQAKLLLSPTTFSNTYRYPYRPPEEVIIDSGAYHHGGRNANRNRVRALHDQLLIAEQFPKSRVTVTHCDVLARDGAAGKDSIDETLRNAEWFMAQDLNPSYARMIVAQARTPDEMYLVVSQLAEFEPDIIAIGGLAKLHRTHRSMLAPLIEGAVEGARTTPLHALGVTATHVLDRLRSNGVTSCDSATATWSAIYGSVIYSHPYRRHRFISEKSSRPESPQVTGYYTSIAHPLPCPCPVCRDDAQQLKGSDARAKHMRCIHNHYHVKLEVEGRGSWQEAYLSAEYQSVITTLLSSTVSSPNGDV